MAAVYTRLILAKGHVQHLIKLVFDTPMTPHRLDEAVNIVTETDEVIPAFDGHIRLSRWR